MRTVEEVRRLRLAALRERYGTLSDLNEKLGLLRRDSTLSQILNSSKSTSSGKPKDMGSVMARRIELALGLELGWMDTDPAYDTLQQRLSQEAMTLAREFDNAQEHERQAMLTLWRTVTEIATQGANKPAPAPTAAPEQQASLSRIRKAH